MRYGVDNKWRYERTVPIHPYCSHVPIHPVPIHPQTSPSPSIPSPNIPIVLPKHPYCSIVEFVLFCKASLLSPKSSLLFSEIGNMSKLQYFLARLKSKKVREICRIGSIVKELECSRKASICINTCLIMTVYSV